MWHGIVDRNEPLSYIALAVAVVSLVMAALLVAPSEPPPKKPVIVLPNELAG